MNKNNKGITLIALVITIVILLILVGITISFMLGDNGILNKTKLSAESYQETAARERLETTLMDLETDKIIDSEYNETTFIDNKLVKENMIINGDIVTVDGWQFEIDRSVPKIVNSLGKGEINEQIIINAIAETSSDYVKSSITVEVSYTGSITSIAIASESITVPEKIEDKYIVTKEVTENGTYGIIVKDENGGYKIASITVTDLTEDMDIYTKADLETFRDNVNSGRTYEGRKVNVKNDIDMQESNWTPIGYSLASDNKPFNGTFDGENHTISKINCIKSDSKGCGLFGYTEEKAIVENITIANSNFKANQYVGAVVGINCSKLTSNCHATSDVRISTSNYGGGIIGTNMAEGTIEKCYSGATVSSSGSYAGGIVGASNGNINSCCNSGSVKGNLSIGGITGINHQPGVTISNCYNSADITATTNSGGITGGGNSIGGILNVKNCYNTGNISATSSSTGGIEGIVYFEGNIQNCYNIGEVVKKGKYIGRIAGRIVTSGKINNCYYLFGTTNNYAIGDSSSTGGTNPEGTIQVNSIDSKQLFNVLNQDNPDSPWKQDTNNINNGMPILNWQ